MASGISVALFTLLFVLSIGVSPPEGVTEPSADLVGVRIDGARLDAFFPVSADGPRPAVVVDGGAVEAEQLAARGYVAVTLRGPTDAHARSVAEHWIRANADVLGVRAEDVGVL